MNYDSSCFSYKTYKYKRIIAQLNEKLAEADSTVLELTHNYEKLEKEFEEYKLRHPVTTGVKGGKEYTIKEESKKTSDSNSKDSKKSEVPENKKNLEHNPDIKVISGPNPK